MAANAGAIRAGKAFVELFTDNSKLTRGLKAAETQVKAWGTSVRSIGTKLFAAGAGVAGGLLGLTKVAASGASALTEMAARTGASVEALSELAFVASQSKTDIEELEKGIRAMQKGLGSAMRGSKDAIKEFQGLGLSVKSLAGLTADQQLEVIADALVKIEDPTLRGSAALKIFGKTGTMILPMLSQGSRGIRELRARARELALTVSTEDAESLDKFNDSLSALGQVMSTTSQVIGVALAPAFQAIADTMSATMATVNRWISDHRELTMTVLVAAAALAALGAALITAGFAFSAIGSLIGILGASLAFVKAVMVALISPMGALAAIFVASGAAILYLSGVFQALGFDALEAFDAIRHALAAGDIAAAAKVLWATLILEWTRGKTAVLGIWNSTVAGMSSLAIDAFAGIETAWVQSIDFMKDAWDGLVAFMLDAMAEPLAKVAEAMSRMKSQMEGLGEKDTNMLATLAREGVRYGFAAMKNGREKEIVDREGERKKRLADIEARRQGAQDVNGGMLAEQLAAAEKKLAEARADFEKAKSDAKGITRKPFVGRDAPNLPDVDLAKSTKLGSSGTFSSFALGGLGGGGSDAAKTAQNTSEMVKQQKIANDAFKKISQYRGGFE